jgi:hypothetical protein
MYIVYTVCACVKHRLILAIYSLVVIICTVMFNTKKAGIIFLYDINRMLCLVEAHPAMYELQKTSFFYISCRFFSVCKGCVCLACCLLQLSFGSRSQIVRVLCTVNSPYPR